MQRIVVEALNMSDDVQDYTMTTEYLIALGYDGEKLHVFIEYHNGSYEYVGRFTRQTYHEYLNTALHNMQGRTIIVWDDDYTDIIGSW